MLMERELDVLKLAEQDTVLLSEASEYRKNIQECINQLGEVLNELVMNTSLGDEQTLLWMSQYVAETRMYLAFLRDLFPEFVKENS